MTRRYVLKVLLAALSGVPMLLIIQLMCWVADVTLSSQGRENIVFLCGSVAFFTTLVVAVGERED